MGEPEAARASYERAAAIFRQLPGVEPEFVVALQQLGLLLNQARRPAEAIPYFVEAVAAREQLRGQDDPGQIELLAELGQNYREAGRLADARAPLERAVALADRVAGDRFDEASAREQLALVWWALGERARAVTLMRAARDGWAAVPDAEQVAVVDRWLRGRR